ncbi:hypothetical protein BUALT_Bualt11G0131100 [Buddleja alternifolia]|uniref:Uncharacterized protein n=1 Tax=Buddleja alternifolia TaxID=168488 RepID=A0AAV6X1X5_9LAMI|nr:hypothetical protein BUALT_Bualt11G0131100 [Buddleja alternifolia]
MPTSKTTTINSYTASSPETSNAKANISSSTDRGWGGRMAGGGNFIHRVISYVANELIVNGLANSTKFQRFAVKTSKTIEQYSDIAAQKKKELAEQMKDVSKNFESFKNQ